MALKKLKKIRRLQPQPRKITILYVEDAAVIRDTIARLLELKGGFRVEYAFNGLEGVEKAIALQPDIVLMDLRMPVMDGHQAIREIKANPKTHHIPVFVVSAWSGKKDRMTASAAGADDYYVKPPDIDQLIDAINAAVGHSP
jgi:two-component system cell cycle response regulator DivK